MFHGDHCVASCHTRTFYVLMKEGVIDFSINYNDYSSTRHTFIVQMYVRTILCSMLRLIPPDCTTRYLVPTLSHLSLNSIFVLCDLRSTRWMSELFSHFESCVPADHNWWMSRCRTPSILVRWTDYFCSLDWLYPVMLLSLKRTKKNTKRGLVSPIALLIVIHSLFLKYKSNKDVWF